MGFALVLAGGVEFAEALADVEVFEVDAFDGVISAAAFDSGPFDDGGGGSAQGFAQVGLLEDFLGAGTGPGVGDEFFRGEVGTLHPVDDVEEPEFDGIGQGDAEVEVPRAGRWINGLLD